MNELTKQQLDNKIDTFLEAKLAKYPELKHSQTHKSKWSISELLHHK